MLDCPKCSGLLEPLTFGDVLIDRCQQCLGIWLDHGERKAMEYEGELNEFDFEQEVGDVEFKEHPLYCPVCQEAELSLVMEIHQTEITYEYCVSCNGSFYDAGELADLSETQAFEQVRSILGALKKIV